MYKVLTSVPRIVCLHHQQVGVALVAPEYCKLGILLEKCLFIDLILSIYDGNLANLKNSTFVLCRRSLVLYQSRMLTLIVLVKPGGHQHILWLGMKLRGRGKCPIQFCRKLETKCTWEVPLDKFSCDIKLLLYDSCVRSWLMETSKFFLLFMSWMNFKESTQFCHGLH